MNPQWNGERSCAKKSIRIFFSPSLRYNDGVTRSCDTHPVGRVGVPLPTVAWIPRPYRCCRCVKKVTAGETPVACTHTPPAYQICINVHFLTIIVTHSPAPSAYAKRLTFQGRSVARPSGLGTSSLSHGTETRRWSG